MTASDTTSHAAPRLPNALAAAAALLAVAWVYRDLPRVYFEADDFLNLYQIANQPLLEYLLQTHGGHILFTRNSLFYLFRVVFGPRSELFFAVVLITHLVNVALLLRLLRRLTRSPLLAAFGAILWGISPVQAGALGWYSVYGQVVATTILLFLLERAAASARDGAPLSRIAPLTWPLLLLLASTSFGVGIAIAVVSPAVSLLILPPSRRRTALCLALVALVVALPFVYDALLSLYVSLSGQFLWRPTAADSLSPALHNGVRTLTMTAYLLGQGVASLLLGFSWVKGVFPSLPSVAVVAIYTVAMVLIGARADSTTRRWLVAMLLLVASIYGIIAVARAPLFKMDALARAAAAPRYHYAATVPLVIVTCLLLSRLGQALSLRRGTVAATVALWAAATIFSYARAPRFLDLHLRQRRETNRVIEGIERVVRGAPGPTVYIASGLFHSVGLLIARSEAKFPGFAAIYTIFFPSDRIDGKLVRFVVDDPETAAIIEQGRRTADLVVARENVPKDAETIAASTVTTPP